MARRAKSLATLLDQVNALAPHRDKSSDGWIGDEKHQQTASDHNPNSAGVVKAQDFTHDPAGGFDSYAFAELLRQKQDRRIKYVISNRKIFGGPASTTYGKDPWKWKPYSGKNPHDMHVHVSVADAAKLYDDASEWDIGGIGTGVPRPQAPKKTLPMLRSGSKGFYVEMVQTALGCRTVDGKFGRMTNQAVRQFQRDHDIDDDGVVGPYTWRELLRSWGEEVRLVYPDPYAKLNEVALAAQKLGAQGTLPEIATALALVVADVLPPKRGAETEEPEKPVEQKYHAVVDGGFFSSDPYDKKVPTAIRTNNPGALNTTAHIATLPGYATADETSPGNKTAIFYAPEYGVLAYWDLLDRYADAGANTIAQIINRYGGGQDYSEYLRFVTKTTGLPGSYRIKLDGSDDVNLTKFAKAMFRYEAGRETPLSDQQISVGFRMAREREKLP